MLNRNTKMEGDSDVTGSVRAWSCSNFSQNYGMSDSKRAGALRTKYRSLWDALQIIADHNARLVKAGKQPSNEQLINEQRATEALALARKELLAELAVRWSAYAQALASDLCLAALCGSHEQISRLSQRDLTAFATLQHTAHVEAVDAGKSHGRSEIHNDLVTRHDRGYARLMPHAPHGGRVRTAAHYDAPRSL
jgi:hypothetical protein